MQICAEQLYSKTNTILHVLFPIVTARRNAVQRRQGRRTTALAYYSSTTCYHVVGASIPVASANLQASREALLGRLLSPAIAACLVRRPQYPIPTTAPSRPTAAAKKFHRPTSVRRCFALSSLPSSDLGVLGVLPSFSGHEIGHLGSGCIYTLRIGCGGGENPSYYAC